MRTDDQLTIGGNSDAYPFYVRKDDSSWQALFRNRAVDGADVYIAHGDGNGMRIRGRTTNTKYSLKLQNLNDDTNVFYNNGKVGLGLQGNVGIGTTSPIHKLHLQTVGRDGIRLEGNNTGDAIFQVDNGGGTHYIFDKSNENTFNIESANDLVFRTNGPSERMRITESGKVQIGNVVSTSNSYKLFVETGILSEKVKVAVKSTGDWSDYVFEEDYELMPIEELEDYVAENKHLPNVPSAEEVVKEGIDMAKMDAKLLEKIEETHLYIIELKIKKNEFLYKHFSYLDSDFDLLLLFFSECKLV